MAEGGGDDPRRRERENHPLGSRAGRRRSSQRLTPNDIGNQARYLLTQFIHERMTRTGMPNAPNAEALIVPGTPTGPPVERMREVAEALRRIGDELDGDESLQSLISRIPADASQCTFKKVAAVIFGDGVFNWGRVVALFYFAYKMAIKAFGEMGSHFLQFIRSVIEWVVSFIVDKVASWILERGGWEAIREYFGTPNGQLFTIFMLGVVCSSVLYWWKR